MTIPKQNYMFDAYNMAVNALKHHDVPVGAVMVQNNQIVAATCNRVVVDNNPTAHAEILCLQQASAFVHSEYLTQCTMYVTLEPCPMCAYAISLARVKKLVFGAYDSKRGAISTGSNIFSKQNHHHHPEIIGGIMEGECKELLQKFFKELR